MIVIIQIVPILEQVLKIILLEMNNSEKNVLPIIDNKIITDLGIRLFLKLEKYLYNVNSVDIILSPVYFSNYIKGRETHSQF